MTVCAVLLIGGGFLLHYRWPARPFLAVAGWAAILWACWMILEEVFRYDLGP